MLKQKLKLGNRFSIVDLALCLGFLASLGYFFKSYEEGHKEGARDIEVGSVESGKAQKRPAGEHDFLAIIPGSDLHLMDMVWVPRGESVHGKIGEKTSFTAFSQTLFILKKPFRDGDSGKELVHLIQGRIEFEDKNGKQVIERRNSISEIPDVQIAEKLAPTDPNNAAFYPRANALLVMKPEKKKDLSLSWPRAVEGFVAIKTSKSDRVAYLALKNANSISIPTLDYDAIYTWHVLDKERKPVFGPYQFEIKAYQAELVDALLKNPPRRPVEVDWQ